MHKLIQHDEKFLLHLDYIEIITQLCGSNNFSSDFGQMSTENIAKKTSFSGKFKLGSFLLNGLNFLHFFTLKAIIIGIR
jgi:hypothetical protein